MFVLQKKYNGSWYWTGNTFMVKLKVDFLFLLDIKHLSIMSYVQNNLVFF